MHAEILRILNDVEIEDEFGINTRFEHFYVTRHCGSSSQYQHFILLSKCIVYKNSINMHSSQ